MNILSIVGLLFMFLGGIGAIIYALGQFQSSRADKLEIINTTKSENIDLKKQIAELKKEREKLSGILEERDNKIQEQHNNIVSLNNKLIEKSEYIEKYMSGGEGYPYVEIKKVMGNNSDDVFLFSVENVFDLPLYNVQIQAFDYEKILSATYRISNEDKMAIKIDDYLNARIFEYNTNEIPPGEFRMSPEQHFYKSGKFFIDIHSRNNRVIQKIVLVQHEKNSFAGYVVIDSKGKILKEHIYNNPPEEIQKDIKIKFTSIPNELNLLFTK